MSILFIGKRFYTNRDAYTERFGRIYQLPYYWSREIPTSLWLIDYHTKEKIKDKHDLLNVISTPILSIVFFITILTTIVIKKPQKIVASGDCYIGLFAYCLAKLCKSKFIFDVYDKYDTFSGYRNLGFKNLYLFLLKKADICLFASKKLQEDSKSICQKTTLVPNGVDTNHFYPRDRNDSRSYFNLDNDNIYIGYFGSMEIERGIDDLIKAIEILNEENPNIYLLLGGKKRKDLNLNHSFIHYLGNVKFNIVPTAMACCNILALPYRNSDFLDNASSCKIGEYISMGIPLVATNSNSLIFNKYLLNFEEHCLAEHSNPKDLKEKILLKLNKPQTHIQTHFNTWKEISKKVKFFLSNS